MQHIATPVARHLHRQHQVRMVAYLHYWLIFTNQMPAHKICQVLGFNITEEKSTLHPTTALVYLGLLIDATASAMRPILACLQCLQELASIVLVASRQDLSRIMGYIAWLPYAMQWPMFLATMTLQRSTYWTKLLHAWGLLHKPRILRSPLSSITVFTDSIRRDGSGTQSLLWAIRQHLWPPTTITLYTDSSSVYYTLIKGKGLT
jgi:hypothetical protein